MITTETNTLGQTLAYTDADGNITTYSYDIDGRVHEVEDGRGTDLYSYDETTGDLTKLVDSAAGTFEAGYDVEGHMTSETLPDGLTAKYTLNSIGEPVGLEYVKTRGCASACTWYTDAITPSIEGRWRPQTSSLAKDSYVYDGLGRISEVQETAGPKHACTVRLYTYDADSDRTGLTIRPSKSKKCPTGPTKGEIAETHRYDEADRLIGTGVTYNPFGDISALPASDAGGSELTSTFYTDNQLQSVTQHETRVVTKRETITKPEESIGYDLDPEGRIRETIATGGLRTADTISHYSGPGGTPAWTTNAAGEFSRNIQGINGRLAAIQNNNEKPVLQLTNLQGDIIATAEDNETATTPLSTSQEPSEYGIPATEAPPKYSWLGAIEIPTELPSGITTMGIRSYIPQLGRFLQPDPVPAGSPNPYAYTFGDPLNETDPRANTRNTRSAGPRPQASPTQIKAQPKPPPNRPPKTPPPAQQHNARSKNKSEPNWKQPGPDPTPSSQKPQTKKNGNGKKKRL